MSAAAGDLDVTFGTGGVVLGWHGQTSNQNAYYFKDLHVLDDGSAIAVGQGLANGFSSFGVFKFTPDGTPDTPSASPATARRTSAGRPTARRARPRWSSSRTARSWSPGTAAS